MSTIIVGAGGFGRETLSVLLNYFDMSTIQFVDDNVGIDSEVDGCRVSMSNAGLLNVQETKKVYVCISNPHIRSLIAKDLRINPYLSFPNLIHPGARLHNPQSVILGAGNIICDGTILTTGIKLGDFNIINLNCTIGHDTVIGNNCSIMPGVSISGGVKLEDNVYVGTGAKLIKSTVLGEGCTVGAGAVVNKDIPAGETWAGVPAKKI